MCVPHNYSVLAPLQDPEGTLRPASLLCAFQSELRSHSKQGGWEAPRTLVRSSFRSLTAARSSLGLAAELLGSPLGSSAARKPAEYKTCCWPCG